MSPTDRAVLAERAAAMRRHLARVAEKLPDTAADLAASRDASDTVILHLWQATQIAIAKAGFIRSQPVTSPERAKSIARETGTGRDRDSGRSGVRAGQ